MNVAGELIFGSLAGTNKFLHYRVLATTEDDAVVRPNEDTLYSSLAYDLSHGDVIINFPTVSDDQFHLMTYYDPFGNVLASLGSGYPNEAGQYRIRMQPDGAHIGLDNSTSTYQGYINSPTTYGMILLRLAVNSTNLDALHGYQNQTTSQNATSMAPTGTPYLYDLLQGLQAHQAAYKSTPNGTETVLGLLAALAPYNPPLHAKQVRGVDSTLSAAGISSGTYTAAAGVDLGAANATAEEIIQTSLYGKMTNFTNEWSMVSPKYMSPDFGIHYAVRAMVARTAYLITLVPNTIYPFWTNASTGEVPGSNGLAGTILNLQAGEALIYDFVGGHPPLKDPGFWSLTMYNSKGYLIENPQGTYRLGDRNNLTYSDGSLVYPPSKDSTSKPDSRPFQILVQAADAPPAANWTSNWLPSPATSGENFTVWLRFYGTQDELINGGYTFPIVTKTTAIDNGTSGEAVSALAHQESGGAMSVGSISPWWVRAFATSMLLVLIMSVV